MTIKVIDTGLSKEEKRHICDLNPLYTLEWVSARKVKEEHRGYVRLQMPLGTMLMLAVKVL